MNNMHKKELRSKLKFIRDSLSPECVHGYSSCIGQRVITLDEVIRAASCFVYVATGSEVQTTSLITALLTLQKEVYVPLMVGKKTMTPCRITGLQDLTQGLYGFLEPLGKIPSAATQDICILPGIGFSEQGARLGSGAGCYDKYLATRHPFIVGLAYECQILPNIPQEPHDKPVHVIVTEQRVIRTGGV